MQDGCLVCSRYWPRIMKWGFRRYWETEAKNCSVLFFSLHSSKCSLLLVPILNFSHLNNHGGEKGRASYVMSFPIYTLSNPVLPHFLSLSLEPKSVSSLEERINKFFCLFVFKEAQWTSERKKDFNSRYSGNSRIQRIILGLKMGKMRIR